MKVLVIGGTHGNEQLGIDLVNYIRQYPLENVDVQIGNPRAVNGSVRFVETDLNRSFGVALPKSYEEGRAIRLSKTVKSYDVVFDFHNTQTPQNNCFFIGTNARGYLIDVAVTMGLNQCIEATYACINQTCDNVISIEISIGDELDSYKLWYRRIKSIADNDLSRRASARPAVQKYRFARRVTWDEKNSLGISGWRPFETLTSKDKDRLCVEGEMVPIFIGSKLTEYYATLLTKTN